MEYTKIQKAILDGKFKQDWECPICDNYFSSEFEKKEHIALEIKETKKALEILSSLK